MLHEDVWGLSNAPWRRMGTGSIDTRSLGMHQFRWKASSQRHVQTERYPSAYWTGGWEPPGAVLQDMEKRTVLTVPGLEVRPQCRPSRPTHSQSLCRLHYCGVRMYQHVDLAVFKRNVSKPHRPFHHINHSKSISMSINPLPFNVSSLLTTSCEIPV
jgi:hypothetical protein